MEIARVTIPKYIRKIQVSEKQRAAYFEWRGDSITGKNCKIPRVFYKNKYNVPSKTVIEDLKDHFYIGEFDNKGKIIKIHRDTKSLPTVVNLYQTKNKFRLCSDENGSIICNPKKVNKPRIQLIKGQEFYSGVLNEHVRGKIMDEIKMCYLPHVESLPVIETYPIRIICEIHDTIKNPFFKTKSDIGTRWDVDNYAYPYLKAFPDLLYSLGKIKDDDRLHITQPPSAIFCPIDNHEDRKLVFIITKDERDVITSNETYRKYHKDSYESEDTELVKDDSEIDFNSDCEVITTDEQKEKLNKSFVIWGTGGKMTEKDLKDYESIFLNPNEMIAPRTDEEIMKLYNNIKIEKLTLEECIEKYNLTEKEIVNIKKLINK